MIQLPVQSGSAAPSSYQLTPTKVLGIGRATLYRKVEEYGIDRPDMRFEMLLKDVSQIVAASEFKVFSGTIADGGVVKTVAVPGGAKFTARATVVPASGEGR